MENKSFRSTKKEEKHFIFGIEEHEENYKALVNNILNIINLSLKVPCESHEIESVSRLGRKGENPRPILITLTTLGKKVEILRKKEL